MAEYLPIATIFEIIWLRNLLKNLEMGYAQLVVLFSNNQANIYVASIPIFHKQAKHIEIDCHLVHEKKSKWID